MKKAKIDGTKKLTLRRNLYTEEPQTYFNKDDYFFVDDTAIFYDRKNVPYYAAETKYGEKGYVVTTGIIFVKEEKRPNGQYTKNSS